jgi:hypothetical protein
VSTSPFACANCGIEHSAKKKCPELGPKKIDVSFLFMDHEEKVKEKKATLEVLLRLRRRIGKQRAFARQLEKTYRAKKDTVSWERAFGEASVLTTAMGFIDQEVEKLK